MCEVLQAVCDLFLFLCFPLLYFFIHPFLEFFILLVHPYCSRYECQAEAGCYNQVHCTVCQPVQYGCCQYQQQIACGGIDSFHDSMVLSLVPSLFSQTGIAMSNHLCSWLMSFSFLNFLKQLCLHLYQHAKLFILNSFGEIPLPPFTRSISPHTCSSWDSMFLKEYFVRFIQIVFKG